MIIQNIKLLHLVGLSRDERRTIFISSLSGLIEFYDFIIFGLMGIYFSKIIFANSNTSNWGVFILFSIFILGYMARPIGMKLYGKIAVNHSSTVVNLWVISLLFISSLAIGMTPTYKEIGILSPIFLMLARLVQGISSGAERQGEYDHLAIKLSGNNHFAILGFLAGNELGQVLGIFVYRGITFSLNSQQLESFGWRIPFFIGSILIIIIFFLRLKFGEPISNKHCQRAILPSYKFIRHFPQHTSIAIAISGLKGCTTFLYLVFIPFSLLYYLHYNYLTISHIIFQTTILSVISVFIINYFITFDNALKLLFTGIILTVPALGFWAWSFMHNKLIYLSVFVIATLANLFSLSTPRVIAGLFPPSFRLQGVTFCHQSGFILFAGITPLFNIGLAHILYRIFPTVKHSSIFFIGTVCYISIIMLVNLFCLRNIRKYASYQELHQLSQTIKQKLMSRKKTSRKK